MDKESKRRYLASSVEVRTYDLQVGSVFHVIHTLFVDNERSNDTILTGSQWELVDLANHLLLARPFTPVSASSVGTSRSENYLTVHIDEINSCVKIRGRLMKKELQEYSKCAADRHFSVERDCLSIIKLKFAQPGAKLGESSTSAPQISRMRPIFLFLPGDCAHVVISGALCVAVEGYLPVLQDDSLLAEVDHSSDVMRNEQ